jgi:ferrochelatase
VIGVVVMAYDSPARLDDVPAYYTHIRRGREPTEAEVADLRARYEAVGGTTALRERTEAQRARLATALGDGFEVVVGNKHAPPFVEDAAARVSSLGVDRIVGVVLAPHYSRASVGEYVARLRASATRPVAAVESWHDLEPWLDFQATAVRDAVAEATGRTKVVFTAHSLPERVLVDDPYPDQLHESAAAIAARAGLGRWQDWGVAWQSAGRTLEPWRGPDVLTVIDELADTDGAEGLVVCPQGFTVDHLEVRYDLDVQAHARAEQRGLRFARTRTVDDDVEVMAALADRVRACA